MTLTRLYFLSVYVGLNLTDTENEVISLLLLNSNHTALSISEEIHKSKRTIERVLASLQEKGAIERIGSKKWEDVFLLRRCNEQSKKRPFNKTDDVMQRL